MKLMRIKTLRLIASALFLFCTGNGLHAQMCTTALQKEKITPTTNFYDFAPTVAGDNNVTLTSITPATGSNGGLGWTGSGNGSIYATSSSTDFFSEVVTQTLSRPLSDVNLAGNGATVSINIRGNDGSNGVGTAAGSEPATFKIIYNGVTYATFTTALGPTTNVAIALAPGVTASHTQIPINTATTVTFTLPSTIPNSGAFSVEYAVNSPGPNGGDDYQVRSISFKSCPASVSGKISYGAVSIGGATSATGQLYVNLVDASGNVAGTAAVAADGTYSIPAYTSGAYTVRLSTTQGTVGQAAPTAGLPSGWKPVSESDGTPNLNIPVTINNANNNNIINNNFEIGRVLNPDFNSGYINQAITGSIASNDKVLAGSSYDIPLVPSGVTNPGSAVPAMNADGSYSFTAATPGVYTFDVPVCTGTPAVCVMNRLTITVADPDIQTNPPVANPDLAATSGTTPVTIKTLANDQPGSNSPALNPGSVSILTAPKNGTATRNATTGDITYTPNTGFVGQDTLYYQVCNTATPTPQCSPSYQVITVDPAGTNNTSATDDYNVTTINTTVSGNVKTNDIDAQGNTTTVTAKTETITGKGTLSIAADGSYTFTPANGYTGPVNFTYTICDNGTPSMCANASLYLLVQPNSTLPVVFGSITAYFKDGILYVNWNTQTEKSCKEYTIEGSIDGVNWKTVGTVLSKARDGNSDTPLNYEFSTGMAAAAFAGMGLALLLLMPGIRNKKIKWLMILAATFTIVACSKKMADEVATGDTPTYIRILQKDIDGTVSYSKIVQVIKK